VAVRKSDLPSTKNARKRFLKFFRRGFNDDTYFEWERDYKWRAHEMWHELLSRRKFRELLSRGEYAEIASRALKVESRTNLLFSFEKIALRDALRTAEGAKAFAVGLYEFLYGRGTLEKRFEKWRNVIEGLPRIQTRVLTWPVVTVFPFIAEPEAHIFVKPNVLRAASERYVFPVEYKSRPNWDTYRQVLAFARRLQDDLADLSPRDMIDIQSFMWTIGSAEYDHMLAS
jgi:hypothetical protein